MVAGKPYSFRSSPIIPGFLHKSSFLFEERQGSGLKILQSLNPDFFEEVCPDFEGGYIGFEVVSKGSYLGEVPVGKMQTRGANCTSVDAMMTGITKEILDRVMNPASHNSENSLYRAELNDAIQKMIELKDGLQ